MGEKKWKADWENILLINAVVARGWYLPFIQYHDTKNGILNVFQTPLGANWMNFPIQLRLVGEELGIFFEVICPVVSCKQVSVC